MKKGILYVTLLVFVLIVGACATDDKMSDHDNNEEAVSVSSLAVVDTTLISNEGLELGKANFIDTAEGVKIHLKADGLEPGIKAMHFHETGKCETPSFTSAGDHFNPHTEEHGFDNPKGHHAGDLPNIEVSKDGTVDVELVSSDVILKSGEINSLLDEDGSSLIIHTGPDDYKTSPSGNAGDRIACGSLVQTK